MRARNLKPGLFKNELLGAADPLITILFQGLWAVADREGRLQDRPLRICAEVFPYRRSVTEKRVHAWLQWLHDESFISRYEVDGKRYIQVLAFWKHQKPHSKEKASEIPALTTIRHQPELALVTNLGSGPTPTKVSPSTGKGGGEHALNPESGLLNPESSLREIHAGVPRGTNNPTDEEIETAFGQIKATYPTFTGNQDWLNAEHHFRLRIDAGVSPADLVAVVGRYRRFVDSGGVSGPNYVITPGKFFVSALKHWCQEWAPPPTKAETRLAGNISAADEFMRRTEAK